MMVLLGVVKALLTDSQAEGRRFAAKLAWLRKPAKLAREPGLALHLNQLLILIPVNN
jgi:hypothetical protein